MRTEQVSSLCCPDCHGDLRLTVESSDRNRVRTGTLACSACEHLFPIRNFIPRFVADEDYARPFGFQWEQHGTTQHDTHSGSPVSETRFFAETGWPRDLKGQTILEAGCGSGRFTQHALSTGAHVIAFDMSRSVDAAYQVHGEAERLLIVQADLYRLPIAPQTCDRVFCFGVLQHTPDVESAFHALVDRVKPDGWFAADVYDRRTGPLRVLESFYRTYYWLRPITRRVDPARLYSWVRSYISTMWPIARYINRIPVIGRKLNRMLMVVDYRGRYDLTDEQLREWAILDTFDLLAPRFDQRQTLATFRKWFHQAAMYDVDVHYGHNGIEGRGRCAQKSKESDDHANSVIASPAGSNGGATDGTAVTPAYARQGI